MVYEIRMVNREWAIAFGPAVDVSRINIIADTLDVCVHTFGSPNCEGFMVHEIVGSRHIEVFKSISGKWVVCESRSEALRLGQPFIGMRGFGGLKPSFWGGPDYPGYFLDDIINAVTKEKK